MEQQSNRIVMPKVTQFDPTIRLRVKAAGVAEDDLIGIVRAFAADHGYKVELRKRPLEDLLWSARLQNATSIIFFKAEIDSLFLFGVSAKGEVLPETEAKPIRDALQEAFKSNAPTAVIEDEALALSNRK